MRVAIVDDMISTANLTRDYLIKAEEEIGKTIEVRIFEEASDFEYEIEEHFIYDLVVLGIKLGSRNGLDLAAKIRREHPVTIIIFVTRYEDYVFEVFEVQAFDFIRKPVEYNRIKKTIMRVEKYMAKAQIFKYKKGSLDYKIHLKEIGCFSSQGRKIWVQTKTGEDCYYGQLGDVEKELNRMSDCFIRINQSTIVNITYFLQYEPDKIVLKYGEKEETYRISRSYRKKVREYMKKML